MTTTSHSFCKEIKFIHKREILANKLVVHLLVEFANEICNYFMLTLLKDRVIKGRFMTKDRVIMGHFMTKDRVIMGHFMTKDRVIMGYL